MQTETGPSTYAQMGKGASFDRGVDIDRLDRLSGVYNRRSSARAGTGGDDPYRNFVVGRTQQDGGEEKRGEDRWHGEDDRTKTRLVSSSIPMQSRGQSGTAAAAYRLESG
jgi:hypothetical protein